MHCIAMLFELHGTSRKSSRFIFFLVFPTRAATKKQHEVGINTGTNF